MNLWAEFKQEALRLGIDDLGIVPAGKAETWPLYHQWLCQGHAATMAWLEKNPGAREHPSSILPSVKSLVMAVVSEKNLLVASDRRPPSSTIAIDANLPAETPKGGRSEEYDSNLTGEILPYALAEDYHHYLKTRLQGLAAWLVHRVPRLEFRAVVDTAPLLEKEWAARAALGFVAKNSLLIHPRFGSRCFLGTLLLSCDSTLFQTDPVGIPFDRCNDCRRCLDACPTGALNPNRTLDAEKCLNYWTIEFRGQELPDEIGAKLRRSLWGCDICRRCCPLDDPACSSKQVFPLEQIENMTHEEFKSLFAGTPVERTGIDSLKRNARALRRGS